MVNLETSLCGLTLSNPLIPASGTFGYGYEFAELYDINILGSFSFKGTTKDARFGSYKGKVRQVRAEGSFSYKYCVGDFADRKSAQATVATVRKTFPQAFVIAVKDGKVVTNK